MCIHQFFNSEGKFKDGRGEDYTLGDFKALEEYEVLERLRNNKRSIFCCRKR